MGKKRKAPAWFIITIVLVIALVVINVFIVWFISFYSIGNPKDINNDKIKTKYTYDRHTKTYQLSSLESSIETYEMKSYHNDGLHGKKAVTKIGNFALSHHKLKKFKISPTVKEIGESAFSNSTIETIEIPDSVTEIGKRAFLGSAIKEITIPQSITAIEESTFAYCTNLTSVTLPEGLESIGKEAFYSSNLESIVIPSTVRTLGECAFQRTAIQEITIPAGITNLPDSLFSQCEELTSVTLPAGIRTIGNWAFSGARKLASITLPDSLVMLGNYVFKDCLGLNNIVLPKNLTSFGTDVFNRQSLSKIYIAHTDYSDYEIPYENDVLHSEFEHLLWELMLDANFKLINMDDYMYICKLPENFILISDTPFVNGAQLNYYGLLMLPYIDEPVYFCFERVEKEYTFVSNGGNAIPPLITDIAWFERPVREGYTFLGWYDNPGLSGDPLPPICISKENMTLYAKWEINGD